MDSADQNFSNWQWNCGGFPNKKPLLQQYLRTLTVKPQIIAIQEVATSTPLKLAGYLVVSSHSGGRGVATLVSKRYNCLSRDLGPVGDGIEYAMTEILMNPPRKGLRRNSLYILNVFCSPSYRRARANSLLKRAVSLAGAHPLVIVGDFKAPHRVWGYTHDTPKGRELWQTAMELDLTLITDKDFPTRRGNSACRDTTPDLSFVKNVGEVKWVNTALDLGSDHYVIEVSLPIARYNTRKFKLIDWDVFRKIRAERAPMAETDFEGWCKGIRDDAAAATKEVVTELDIDKMDSKLAHLLEAKQALLTRWKGQRHNRRLRKKVSEVNREIEHHCKNLCKQQWAELCESVEGQLRSGKSWGLLKHLLDEGSTRSSQRRSLARAIHLATDSTPDVSIVYRLIDKYLPVADSSAPTQFPDYAGACAKHILVITGAPIYTNRKGLEPNLQGFHITTKEAHTEEFK
ncbi:uncharacterized protein [Dermacentor albipictus]|uniref:uncharacterized protein n=1 Tax=Dermacentor albipictus TaxID=60249 RepID=UPI0038FC18CE